MGTQFWWFYDVIAAAIILICMFIWGRKGIVKSVLALTACFLSAIISFGISSGIAKTLYGTTVRVSNIKKLNLIIDDNTLLNSYTAYLESLGYNIVVKPEKLDEILCGNGNYTEEICTYVNNINGRKVEKNDEILRQKVREGYAVVISDLVSKSLKSKYVTETAKAAILEKGNIDGLIPLMSGREGKKSAAEYIVDNYTADAYNSLFRLGALLVLFVVLLIFTGFVMRSVLTDKDRTANGVVDHIIGGIIGAVNGGIFVLVAAVIVRLASITGSNEMLFFNNDAVDKTYVFRFFYDLITIM